jgi:hypothetical protein
VVSFIVFWVVMLRGCGLFHCVLGCYVERLWPLSLCFGRLCREVVVSFIVLWEVMLRGCGLFHCVFGGYVERLWSLSLCFRRLC